MGYFHESGDWSKRLYIENTLPDIRKKLNDERRKAVKGFNEDVKNGRFPDKDYTVSMLSGEKEKLIEALNS